jgi:hypothetical protein
MNNLCCCALHLLIFFLLFVSSWFMEVAMTRQPNKNKFWNWKCHISMKNRTLKFNEVSLESSGIYFYAALETLKVKTMAPWLHNQTKQILNLKKPHLHEKLDSKVEWGIIGKLKYSMFLMWEHITNSMCFGDSQGQDNGTMPSQPNKKNFELDSATSSLLIGPQSWMRYHCKAMVFYFYVVSVQYQIKGLHGFSKARK